MAERANYALLFLGVELGPSPGLLDIDWATHAGDETGRFEFEVPTADARDPYLGVQAYEVGSYGHEIVVNGDPLGGFDLPPADGWQYWMDTFGEAGLEAGTNSLRVARGTDTDDAFAVGNVTVHWKEPVEE